MFKVEGCTGHGVDTLAYMVACYDLDGCHAYEHDTLLTQPFGRQAKQVYT